MKTRENNIEAFFALLRAGLWETEVQLSMFGNIDFSEVCRIADEQSVVGVVAAGLEHIHDIKFPKDISFSFAGTAIQLEHRNMAMNTFLTKLYDQLQKMGIYSILVKGQGIAQCYERPLWRSAGDIDLLLNAEDYEKAKQWLLTVGKVCEDENDYKRHIEFLVGSWDIELHGSLRSELWGGIDRVIDEVQNDVFFSGSVRSWQNGNTTIFLPAPDNDVIFVFTHILQHFFRGGIGLRQICDWCRLLWTYREKIDKKLLEKRLKKMGVMTEWRTFAAMAVGWLGMPVEAMPLYLEKRKYVHKAKRLCDIIMASGNFGYNRDLSYKAKKSFFVRMVISLYYRTYDFIKQAMIFPMDACRAYLGIWKTGLGVVSKRIN